MNSKRSYLDSLNAGRPRKAHASLEELNRSLEDMESRWGRREARPSHGNDRARSRWADDILGDRTGESRLGDRHRSPGWTYQEIARDIDRVRSQEEGVASVGRIAGELKGLREELRHQMTAGLRREFDALRKDIERAYGASPLAADGAALGEEFERLSDAIHALAERSDDRGIDMLRLELEQVRNSLASLAREETLRSADQRWEEFDRRWSHIEHHLAGNTAQHDPALAALNRRLQEIAEAVNNLPESLCLRSLEEKVRILATAVDHFASQQDRRSDQTFALIEERLDEISRAIVASTAMIEAPHFDPAPFERIEARITSLARQVEELIEDRPSVEVIDRLSLLSQRMDQIATHGTMPDKSLERLASQVSAIAEKIDSNPIAPDTDHILRGIDDRFIMLSDMLDRRQGDAMEHGQALFRDLEQRLENLAVRLDERRSGFDDAGIMDAIDARFAELSRRLDIDRQGPGDEAIRHMEARLEDISARLESSAAQVAAIDPELIRSLEAQVAGLSAHLARPVAPLPDFEDIAPRLGEIEQSIAGQRDAILEAARQAAENAVRALANTSSPDATAVVGLAEDLKSLETLTRHSDERNTRTFEAIHDTLLKIVDRLGALEHRSAATASEAPEPRKMAVNAAPSIQPDTEDGFTFAAFDPGMANGARTPHEAAAAAAAAAIGTSRSEETGSPSLVRSMFGGFGRAFSGRDGKADASSVGAAVQDPEAPTLDLDEPLDPSIANRPLEPGSGAPDLNAIMRRVRDERGQTPHNNDKEAAKSDFIAAARRAAQAAAAEAGSMKASDTSGQRSSFGLGEFLRRKRKAMLMGTVAIVLALGAMQLGQAFLADDEQLADGDAFTTEPAPATAASPDATPAEPALAKTESQSPDSAPGDMPANEAASQSRTAEAPVAAEPSSDVDMNMPTSSIDRSDDRMSGLGVTAPVVTPFPAPEPTEAAKGAFEPAPANVGPAPLRDAADSGDPRAMFEIGSRYAEGRGVEADMPAAARWYERSAELGFAPAQYRIGNLYEKGLGVGRDIAKAKTWYQMAAAQGNASAMHNLAVLFAMGADGVVDNDSAARWFIEAAELGVKDSQFNLGILAAKGIGMQQNLEESYKWFALVAKTGDQDASAKRDEVAKMLRPEQLERARAAAELWKPKTVDAATNAVDIPASWQDGPVKTADVDMKKAVANIQKILNKNGYDAGGADGVMGDKTKTAIAAFQKDNGMDPTGRVDETLVKALIERK
ncbi:MAG TPA: peptidoglycan-binding protein [Rhizobiaceae bacterium]|nr:peptidoglycan-binding protein [Rhizobiaceae bacterium]